MQRIINHMTDDDVYNFHQGCFLYHKYPDVPTGWSHKLRMDVDLRPIIPQIKEQLEMMADLKLTSAEAEHMLENPNIHCTEEYLEYLTKTQVFNPKEITIVGDAKKPFGLSYAIPEAGRSPLVEVKTMAMISELYFKNLYADCYSEVEVSGERWLDEQVLWLRENAVPELRIQEMGGRRRFSYAHQEKALLKFWKETPQFFSGTSNVHLGMKHNIPSSGTIAHLLIMFFQSIYALHLSQKEAYKQWNEFYCGKLKIALTDTFGDEKWERDFDLAFSIMYPIERNDSGNPYLWGRSRLDSAKVKGLNTKDRGLIFSNGIDFVLGNDLTKTFRDECTVGLGIGTFITNSMGWPGHVPLNQVCKMMWANGVPLCKLSSDFSKNQCEDNDMLAMSKKVAMYY